MPAVGFLWWGDWERHKNVRKKTEKKRETKNGLRRRGSLGIVGFISACMGAQRKRGGDRECGVSKMNVLESSVFVLKEYIYIGSCCYVRVTYSTLTSEEKGLT